MSTWRVWCRWWCAGLLVGAAGALWAGEAAAPADLDALKKQVEEWSEKARQLSAKLREIEAKVQKTPEVVKLQEAEDAASKAYRDKAKADAGVAAALKAESEARAALDRVVQDKLAASADAKAIRAELESLDDKRARLEFQQALAQLELAHPSSAVNREMDKDPELLKLREAADEAYRRGADREARDKARKAYDEARKARKEALPAVKKLTEEIAAANKEAAELLKQHRDTSSKLGQLRYAIQRGDDPDAKAAREKLDAAMKAVADAYGSEEIKAARKPWDDARKAYSAKVDELMAADQTAVSLRQEREALAKQMYEAQRKLRAAQPPQK